MRTFRLGQHLARVVALSLVLLIVGVAGLGLAIRRGDLAAPTLDVALGGLHIIAYITEPIACRPYLPCSGRSRDYVVIWVSGKATPDAVRETGRPILTLPMQR